jgi:hypothetical protein
MKNNKATWIFLLLLVIALGWRAYSFRRELHNPIHPLLVFVIALYSAISFTEWVCGLHADSKWFSILPFLRHFTHGANVPFWHRQLIFFGGFGLGYLYLISVA